MTVHMLICQLTLVAFAVTLYSNAARSSETWQTQRLLHPSEADLASERQGKIIIYSGLTNTTVARAMDENFDRIGSMMFTRTIVTDEEGAPLRDPETGEIVTEDDGCD